MFRRVWLQGSVFEIQVIAFVVVDVLVLLLLVLGIVRWPVADMYVLFRIDES